MTPIRTFRFSLVPLLTLLAACAHGPGTSGDAARLRSAVNEYTEGAKRLDAYWAHYFGVEEDLSKFGDYGSPEFFAREKALYSAALERLNGVAADRLAPADRRLYRLFREDLENKLAGLEFPQELLAFQQMDNRLLQYKDDADPTLTLFPFDTVKRYEAFLSRSEGFPAYVDRQIALLRRGMREGVTLNCQAAAQTPNTWRDALEPAIERNPFWRPVTVMPASFAAADRARLSDGFRAMIRDRILPGYLKFDRFFREEYRPRCRKAFGIGSLPKGEAWYRQRIRASTGLALEAREIHEIGRREVARIASEMRTIQARLGRRGSLPDFLRWLTNEPKNYFATPAEMLSAFEAARAAVDAATPQWFRLVPKTPYRIVESSNPEDASARYMDPTDSLPYGRFILNTKNVKSTPRFGVMTLSLHEAVPGHHFQLALQFEGKKSLTEYQRKLYSSTAFVEGWALYAESLGVEMGLFTDPMQRLGNLSDEMLRAVRLVVDTGIHAYGWDQRRVRSYMASYLPSDAKDIENEANRYSVWPGQALAYKLGQLRIRELRAMAERELGSRFDVRDFHDVVLRQGTVSLTVLEAEVRDWIERTRQ